MVENLILTEVETLANFPHNLHSASCNRQACTETVNGFNKDEFSCQLNTISCDTLLQSTAPLHQISSHTHTHTHRDASFVFNFSECYTHLVHCIKHESLSTSLTYIVLRLHTLSGMENKCSGNGCCTMHYDTITSANQRLFQDCKTLLVTPLHL